MVRYIKASHIQDDDEIRMNDFVLYFDEKNNFTLGQVIQISGDSKDPIYTIKRSKHGMEKTMISKRKSSEITDFSESEKDMKMELEHIKVQQEKLPKDQRIFVRLNKQI